MRILGLKVAGFGPYRSEQTIDFRRFDDDGIFLIAGRTGAGKSSILDAVCFALYGDVPRYEKRESQVRSQHCGPADPSEVELEFQVRHVVYRIRRTPRYERLKRSGSGTTTAEPEAELAILEADGPRIVATRPKEVGIALAELLPISRDQFLQVVLLAQNRFQEFLLAPTDKRRELLRTLFGTDRFQRLERDLLETRSRSAAELEATARDVAARADAVAEQTGAERPAEPDAAWFAGAADEAEAAAETAEADAAVARARAEAAERMLAGALATQELQARRDAARLRLAELAADDERIAALRSRLAAARRADAVHPRIAAQERAAADLATATARQSQAAEALLQHPAPDGLTTEERIEALLTARGALSHPLAVEGTLPAQRQALAAARTDAAAAAAAIQELETRLATLPERIAALDTELAALALAAADADPATARAAELTAALTAAQEATRLAERTGGARRAEAAAAADAAAAAARLDAALTGRIAGQAVELAAALVPGDPCPVCGSLEHPAPVRSDAPAVTAAEVAAARSASSAAQAALTAAAATAAEAERRLAAAEAAAGGRDVSALEEQLAAARERIRVALAAPEARTGLSSERAAAADDAAAGAQRLVQAREHRAAAEAGAAALESALARDVAVVAEGRGDAPSVAARAARLEDELAAVRDAAAADAAVRRAEAALEETTEALRLSLADQGFTDAAEAAAARLDGTAEAAADAAVRAHEQGAATAREVLAEPTLAALPEEPVDPQPERDARDAAAAAFETAVATAGALGGRARAVRSGASAAIALLETSAEAGERYRQVRDLAATVHGDEPNTRRMRLETYVLAAQLEQIIAAANLRLERMTAGRYALDLDDERQHRNVETGLGIGVRDAHTGLVRQAASLSGGEMFLASLALALGLAEVVSAQAGGIRLDTLFVDEGFGSLDAETLDTAMAALDDLRTGGRTIGLISHVESMQERIPARLAVEVLPTGDSRVVQPAA
ncbi:MAG TPA: AAA family ATPase [Amnibacterium sp.]|jgi:exonuclease SbcC|uniref:AAA family ATPase n=1 Tax=Amnibacterium sp. TaxID=1872496 RepID=UPI002F94E031